MRHRPSLTGSTTGREAGEHEGTEGGFLGGVAYSPKARGTSASVSDGRLGSDGGCYLGCNRGTMGCGGSVGIGGNLDRGWITQASEEWVTRWEAQTVADRRIYYEGTRLEQRHLNEGHEWYMKAQVNCAFTAYKARASGANPRCDAERVAAATAILSPLQDWDTNVMMVERLALDKDIAPLTFHKWWRKARSALWSLSPPLDRLATGPKVHPFYRALSGDRYAVVVDRWMLRLVYPDDRGYPARIKRIQNAITQLAEEMALYPRELQAALWVMVRERGE